MFKYVKFFGNKNKNISFASFSGRPDSFIGQDMLSYDNKVSGGWCPNNVGERTELLMPLDSPKDTHPFLPENSVTGIDQCIRMSGITDSAYNSLVLPEFSPSLGYSENGSASIKQVPYMDSRYIRGIYDPSVGNPDHRQIYENNIVQKSSYQNLERIAPIGTHGNMQVSGLLHQSASSLARFSPLLRPLPSPATLEDNSEANRNVEETHDDGTCFNGNAQVNACIPESHKALPFHTPVNCWDGYWLSNGQKENPATEKNVVSYPNAPNTTKECSSAFSTKSAIQKKLKSGSLAKTTQEIPSAQHSMNAYNIPKAMSSKSSLSRHTSCNAVNDPQENKQYLYAYSVHKLPFTEAGLTSTAAAPRKQEGQLHSVLNLPRNDDCSGWDHSIYKSRSGLNYPDNSVPKNSALGIIDVCEHKECIFHSEEENHSRLLKIQKKPESQPLDREKTAHGKIYETFSSGSIFSHDSEEASSQLFNGLGKTEQEGTSRTDFLIKPRQEEMIKPFGFSKLLFSKADGQSQNDSVKIKINRKTTPLLYYLSGGRNSSFMSQIQEHKDVLIKSPKNNCPDLAEPIVISKDSNIYVDNTTIKNDDVFFLGSSASSLDEKFNNDYREKLKVAQRKVLRETSFKRRDLQMSLPIRLKENPSSRPSIQHLRSLSLSSTNEDSKPIPPLKTLRNIYPEDESKKLHTVRTGGRKRTTKEQKKMSYSEPEKLHRLDEQRDQNVSWGQKNARSQSEEISGQDTRIIRSKVLDNPSRDISKARLKQIQHNALLEYMERKTWQQPSIANNGSQQNLPLQLRTLNSKRFLEGSTRKLRSTDSFCQFPASGRIHESPVFPAAIITDRGNIKSPDPELLNSKIHPAIPEESPNSQYVPAQGFFQPSSSASSNPRGRSKSVPSPVQNSYRSVVCSTLLAQDCEYPTYHSSSVSEKDSTEGEENELSIEKSRCEEITLELTLSPKEKSRTISQGKQEISENSDGANSSGEIQWQHMEKDTSDHSGNRTDYCTVLLDQKEHQNLSSQSATLKVLPNEREHQFLSHDTDFSMAHKSPQDQKDEHLAVEISDNAESLTDILMLHPSRKTVLDLMEGIFPVDLSVLGRSCRRKWGIQSAQANDQRRSEYATNYELKNYVRQSPEDDKLYMNQILYKSKESVDVPERIISNRRQLISSIQAKLQILQDERELIHREAKDHVARGKVLESLVQDLCKPNEYERYLLFIGDLEKVVSLLLCLSSRLARILNAMEKIDENTDAEEKQSLNERHRLLSRQQEDAKDLKENLDRRERVVSDMLSKYMVENQLQDYRQFIQEKTILLIEQKDLEEHIKFLEEQLERLENSSHP